MIATYLLASVFVAMDGEKPDAPAPPLPLTKPIETQIWQGYYTAAVHVRYHQQCAAYWHLFDTASRVVAIVLGVCAFAAPFILGLESRWVRRASTVVGLIALLVAVALNVMCFGDWYQQHALAAERWTELQGEWHLLMNQRGQVPATELAVQFDALRKKQVGIEKAEPAGPDKALLARCEDEENTFLGIAPNPADGAQHKPGGEDTLKR